ncbi:MAG: type 4a pilus biogenesis protein PilO [Actinomycetes bacterium]
MNRTAIALGVLAALLLTVLWWVLLMSPRRDEIAAVEQQVLDLQAQQTTVQQQIVALQEVRATAPEIEADLVAVETVLPSSAALPSAIRQLAQAADDSGVTLTAVVPGRPVAAATADPASGLAEITIAVTLEGSYYQLVDFLRRVEDPTITPRAILWDNMGVTIPPDPGYPTLAVTLTGRAFAVLPPLPGAPAPETAAPPADGAPADGSTDAPVEGATETTPEPVP